MKPVEDHVGVSVFALASVSCCVEGCIFPTVGMFIADSPALETWRLCDGELSLNVLVVFGFFFFFFPSTWTVVEIRNIDSLGCRMCSRRI